MIDLSSTPELGKYTLVEPIGEGAMARVFKVRHTQLGHEYALKILDGGGGRMRDRMLREGRVQAGLRHPNVVAVHDVMEVEGQPALLLEYVDGPTLSRYILGNDPIDLEQVDQLAQDLIRGVRAVHRAGHLHRDLKPSNILLARHEGGYIPKIADFGLVKVFGDPHDPARTKTGQLMGSPAYMSPEQTQSSADLDQRTDIWALGVVLYQLVTGTLAFPHRDLVTVFSLIRSGEFRDPRTMRDRVPERMWNAILGAMTVDRNKRIADCDTLLAVWRGEKEHEVPVTVETFGEGLEDFDGRIPTTAEVPQAKVPQAAPPQASGVPGWVWPGVAAGLAVALALVVGILLGRPTEAPAPVPAAPRAAPVVSPPAAPAPAAPVAPVEAPVPTPAPEVIEPVASRPAAAPIQAAPAPSPAAVEATTPTPPPRANAGGSPPAPEPVEAPAPAVPPQPVATPEPVAQPASTPAEALTQPGRFSVSGEAERVWLVRNGTHYDPGEVPAGSYTIAARFPGRPLAPITGVTVEIGAGGHTTIHCTAGFYTCKPLP